MQPQSLILSISYTNHTLFPFLAENAHKSTCFVVKCCCPSHQANASLFPFLLRRRSLLSENISCSHLLCILSSKVLCLRCNSSLVGVSMGSLLTAVKQITIFLGYRRWVRGHLLTNLVGSRLEVAFTGKVRLFLRIKWTSLGCGT